jgi:hypothetical protein
MATGPNKVRRTAQRQLAGETGPAASDVQMLPACHVVPRLCFAAIADPHQVRPAGVLPTLPPCGSRHTFAWLAPQPGVARREPTWSTARPPSSMRPEWAHDQNSRDPAQIDVAQKLAVCDRPKNELSRSIIVRVRGPSVSDRRGGDPAWQDGGRAVLQVEAARRGSGAGG